MSNDPAKVHGEFNDLSDLIIDAVTEVGEKNANVLIAKYHTQLVNCANKVVDDVNRHPYFLQLLEPGCQFEIGHVSVQALVPYITVLSGLSAIGPYMPIRIVGVGMGNTPGPLHTFTLDSWTNGQRQVRIADYPAVTVADAPVTPLYTARIAPYPVLDTYREIGSRVVVEGIKYYWAIDREITTRPQNVQKCRVQYYTELNSWLGQRRNAQGLLEIDHDQRGHDY